LRDRFSAGRTDLRNAPGKPPGSSSFWLTYASITIVATTAQSLTQDENRMRRGRDILVLVAVPALVSLAVTILVLSVVDSQRLRGQQVIVLPTTSGTALIPPVSTQPQSGQSSTGGGESNPSQTAANSGSCQNPVHIVTSGETLSTIASQYRLTADDLIAINQTLDPNFNPDFLSVGQQLVIPECGVPTQVPTSLPTFTAVATLNIPTPISTATEVPPGTVSIKITRVLNAGDITREAVSILNSGSPVDLQGWRISSGKTKDFVFPAFRLFTGGSVTIFSGVGENTAINLYWGLTDPIWRLGDSVSLLDASGKLIDQYKVAP
jgi:LysM repeat protein